MRIERATTNHVRGITEIYNDAVTHTTAIWNEQTVDEANRAAWLQEKEAGQWPVFVATEGMTVMGYSTYGPFRPHDGYRFTVEHSLYVHPEHRRRGVGTLLLDAVVTEANAQGFHAMVGAVDAANQASIDLHVSRGFERVGFLPQIGIKWGKRLDLVLLQLTLR